MGCGHSVGIDLDTAGSTLTPKVPPRSADSRPLALPRNAEPSIRRLSPPSRREMIELASRDAAPRLPGC